MATIVFKPIARDLGAYKPKEIMRAFEKGLAEVGEEIHKDFNKTTKTWSPGGTDGKPIPGGVPRFRKFGPRMIAQAMMLEVSTSHSVYYYLNFGTRAHTVRARHAKVLRFRTEGRGSYRAKTRQGWIGSQGGGPRGPWTMRRSVKHPGNFGRGWDVTIAEQTASKQKLTKTINAGIRAALGAMGTFARGGPS